MVGKKIFPFVPLFLFFLVAGIGIIAAPHIGPAWDEPDNIVAGGQYIKFFESRFDPSVLTRGDTGASMFEGVIFTQDPTISHYPPVPNYVGTLFAMAGSRLGFGHSASEIITSFHLASVVFFAVLVVTVYQFGLLLGMSRYASAGAAILTFLYPTMFGHGISDLKDVAQVSLFTLSLYYLTRAAMVANKNFDAPSISLAESPQSRYKVGTRSKGEAAQNFVGSPLPIRLLVLGAVIWGLGLATKFNAVYVPIIWVAWIIVSKATGNAFFRGAQRVVVGLKRKSFASLGETLPTKHKSVLPVSLRQSFNAFQKAFLSLLLPLFLVLVIGLLTAFLVWPYLWFDPIHRAMEVVHYFTTVGQGYQVFWDGRLYQVGVGRSMWWYPGANILLGTPIPLLVAILVGIVAVVARLITRSRNGKTHVLLFLWILIPLARAVLPSSAFYDGMRHFMEVIPPFMLLAMIGVESLAAFVSRKFSVSALYTFIILAALIVGQLVLIDSTYFPYSAGYYNVLAGDANTQYDRDIEALSVREAIDYIHSVASPVRVWVPVGGHLSWYYLTGADQYVYNAYDAQFIVLVNKSSHITRKDFEATVGTTYRLVHTVSRQGAIFAWVYSKNP